MLRMKYLLLAVFVVALGSLAACGGDADKTEKTEKTDTSSSAANTTGEQASGQASAEQKPTQPVAVTRTKEEALALAKEIAQKAKDGQDFAELAKEYSEGPSGPRGGDLGVWVQGRMVPEFDEAILGMEIGGISDPVETAFGYHVIMRKKVEKVAARHILIMHEGSMRKPPNVTRTKEEALARAQEVKKKLAAGEDFQALAKEYSDGPSAPRGGDLGPFGRGVMHPAFESAAFGLDVDGVSDVVETPFGFHLIQRYR